MGFDYNGVRFLTYIYRQGYKFVDTAMLGRQYLHTDESGIESIFREANIIFKKEDIQRIVKKGGGYSENLLQFLCANKVDSFDYSNYEKPTIVHDFNERISNEFDEKYDLVVDGGSLEHIFNYPVAVHNCLRMVKVGGVFITITPCNNICGHGFYQFSPELYFSLLTKENGFSLLKLFVYENSHDTTWFEVTNPRDFGNRVNLTTKKPIMMLVAGVKTNRTPNILKLQQSDYELIWNGHKLNEEHIVKKSKIMSKFGRQFLSSILPSRFKICFRRLFERPPFDPNLFSKAIVFIEEKK